MVGIASQRSAGSNLCNTDFSEELLTGVDFNRADFEDTNFTDVYLSYATFADANLEGLISPKVPSRGLISVVLILQMRP